MDNVVFLLNFLRSTDAIARRANRGYQGGILTDTSAHHLPCHEPTGHVERIATGNIEFHNGERGLLLPTPMVPVEYSLYLDVSSRAILQAMRLGYMENQARRTRTLASKRRLLD